jgi:hypothetical protein
VGGVPRLVDLKHRVIFGPFIIGGDRFEGEKMHGENNPPNHHRIETRPAVHPGEID